MKQLNMSIKILLIYSLEEQGERVFGFARFLTEFECRRCRANATNITFDIWVWQWVQNNWTYLSKFCQFILSLKIEKEYEILDFFIARAWTRRRNALLKSMSNYIQFELFLIITINRTISIQYIMNLTKTI